MTSHTLDNAQTFAFHHGTIHIAELYTVMFPVFIIGNIKAQR